MNHDLSGWRRDWGLMEAFFSETQIQNIEKNIRQMKPENIVFCSFESRFARSGGLAAVTKIMLPYLKKLENVQRVILLTPFYPNINPDKPLKNTGLNFNVVFDNHTVSVEIFTLNDAENGGVEEYYLKAEDFFDAANDIDDPYGYCSERPGCNEETIRYNALFFCKAVPLAAHKLGLTENIVFHLQEWQTTLVSLTAKEALTQNLLTSCCCILTLHNPFDSWISWEELAHLQSDYPIFRHPISRNRSGLTALQLGLRLIDGPVATVSRHFAGELTDDQLQAGHFAPHLQDFFKKNGVYGVNNGLFIRFPEEYSPPDLTCDQIRDIKNKKRKELINVLTSYHPPEQFGELTWKGGSIANLPDEVPLLVMSGRLDPFQKGFDILLRALEKMEREEFKVILSPLPLKKSDLDYFHEIACKCKGDVTVFPIRMEAGYAELQTGGTFGVMPSIYEPFGAAIEYMVSGTVTIARATGGLVDQIHDQRYGFLFRENPFSYTLENIREFAAASDIVQIRKRNPWAQSMAESLYKKIREAAHIYRTQPERYYQMIQQGFLRARSFTWERAAAEYLNIINHSIR